MGAMVVVVTQGVVAHISNAQRPPSYLKNFYGSFFNKNVKLRLNQSRDRRESGKSVFCWNSVARFGAF